MEQVHIRDALPEDAADIAAIYNAYVLDTVATFEMEAVDAVEMARRIAAVREQDLPWLAVEARGEVRGYAYASPWKSRAAYARSVEASIYLDRDMHGRGLGERLYAELIERLRRRGVHVVIGGISLPNEASIALHRKLGFEAVGTFREVGHKQGRWVDVGYWQLRLGAA